MIDNEKLQKLNKAFVTCGFELRLVGGCVRDFLSGKTPHDYDLCTNATPMEMIGVAATGEFAIIPTGISHGTMTFVVDSETFEVTTLRIDQNCDGRHAEVEFTRDWELDASRRDFTINAMMMDFNGKIYDWFGGQEDLRNGRVRFVGNAKDRIEEDYLRIMRWFRFFARFGTTENLYGSELDVFLETRNGLENISVERIWMELKKILESPRAYLAITTMNYFRISDVIGLPDKIVHNLHWAPDAICALSKFFDNVPSAQVFATKYKLSTAETKKLLWLVSTRKTWDWDPLSLKIEITRGTPIEYVLDYAKTQDLLPLIDIFEDWTIPTFPVSGDDLKSLGFKEGKDLGYALKQLRTIWENSEFKTSKEELLQNILKTS